MIEQNIISKEMKTFIEERKDDINLIVAEMVLLLEGNTDYYRLLEKQSWFQIICGEITGDPKVGFDDFERNESLFESYISQLLLMLVSNGNIDFKTQIVLTLRIKDIYVSFGKVKTLLEALLSILEEQIDEESVLSLVNDNIIYDVIYSNKHSFVIISNIISIFNPQIIDLESNSQEVIDTLEKENIINDNQIDFVDVASGMMNLTDNEAGYLLLFFGAIRSLLMANILEKVLLEYYLMSNKVRKMRKPRAVVSKILDDTGVSPEDTLTSREFYNILTSVYSEKTEIQEIDKIHEQLQEELHNREKDKQEVLAYIEKAKKIVNLISNMVPTWEEAEGNLQYAILRKKYTDFIYGVRDVLRENSETGIAIHASVCNLTFFAKTLFNKYSYLQFDHIWTYGDAKLKIENGSVEGFNDEYYSLADAYNQLLETTGIKIGKNFDINRFPEIIVASILYHFIRYSFIEMYDYLFDKILQRIEEDKGFLNEIRSLTQRFPIDYIDNYQKILLRPKTSVNDMPHVEFKYNYNGKTYKESNEVQSLFALSDYETTKINVTFCNVPILKYTVSYEMIENEYINIPARSRGRAVDVKWGEWVGADTVEFLITKRTNAINGVLGVKIKLYVKEYPEIAGLMEFTF